MKISRVNYGFSPNPLFEEHLEFSHTIPHSIRKKRFLMDEFVPFHYGNTMEILLCSDLKGEVIIDSNHYRDLEENVFIIPPNTIHATNILVCEGTLYTLKFSFEYLKEYIDIEKILAYLNKDLFSFAYQLNCFADLILVANKFFEEDEDIFDRMKNVLTVFEILSHQNTCQSGVSKTTRVNNCTNMDIKGIINWTKDNFTKQITLQEIADFSGYSKYYFCSQFKKYTGLTYLTYLNQIRITHAKLLLSNPNTSITSISFDCGFESQHISHIYLKKYLALPRNHIGVIY